MVRNANKPQMQLKIPDIPKFPLSSPITEEIVTPTSSSSEDREMEKNRPFEYLSKMSNRNQIGYKPGAGRISIPYTSEKSENSSNPYSRRKNTERPVGLNLVTDLSQSASNPRTEVMAAPFVDLNDLKVLSRAREEERSVQQGIKGILKKGNRDGFHRLPDDSSEPGEQRRTSWINAISKSPKRKLKDDLSPSDRPIIIGITMPFDDSPQSQDAKSKELDSAGTQQTPLTPSIIVTPAKEDTFWPGLLALENARPRAASSVYSQPTPYLGADQPDIPPVPALPAFCSTTSNEGKSPDIQGLSVDSVRKRRSYSTGAVDKKEEDRQSIGRSRSYSNENINQSSDRLSVNTQMNRHASHGWWNYLLSPLLGRTSTILSRNTRAETPRPPVPTIATQSTSLTDDWWEGKEVSYFSPDTPDATEARRSMIPSWQPTDGNPFADFDWSIEDNPKSSRDPGTLSFMSTDQRVQGTAAEYYQACAHELFSGRPYFECVNHVCSITPKDKVPALITTSSADDAAQGERNLLIDVDDMPRTGSPGNPGNPCTSRSSVTSINSGSPDEPNLTTRALSESSSSPRHIEAPIMKTPESPKANSHIPDSHGSARAPAPPSEDRSENQPTYPSFRQPREVPEPPSEPPSGDRSENKSSYPSFRQLREAPAPFSEDRSENPSTYLSFRQPREVPALPEDRSEDQSTYPSFRQPREVPEPPSEPPSGDRSENQSTYPSFRRPREAPAPPSEPPSEDRSENQSTYPSFRQPREVPEPPSELPSGDQSENQSTYPSFRRPREAPAPPSEPPSENRSKNQSTYPLSSYPSFRQPREIPEPPSEPPSGDRSENKSSYPSFRQLREAPAPFSEDRSENPSTYLSFRRPRETPAPIANVYVPLPSAYPTANIYTEPGPSPPPANTDVQRPQPAVAPAPIAISSPEQAPPPSYGVQPHPPYSASPRSLQEATERVGSIPMSQMPAGPAPAYTPHGNCSAALPPRVMAVPITRDIRTHSVTETDRIENRRRVEREDTEGGKSRGVRRGRGCFIKKGCFGKLGKKGKLKRRWYFAIFILLLLSLLGSILPAVLLTRSGDNTPVQSQWLNLTGYPPMPTGISTIAGTEAQVQQSGCINPSSLWSCALPKEEQAANAPYAGNQPNFRVEIRFKNGTYDHSTAVVSRSLEVLASRSTDELFNPSPSPPSVAEQTFLGNATDGNSVPYAGEETPFYITIISPVSSGRLSRRSSSNPFPDIASLIPSPSTNLDGTAAAATLYPLPSSQPVRLYNRGEDNEHYGFYNYFDKSIFLSSTTPLTGHQDTTANDTDGGSTEADARVRCTWAQTRFLVQIWTKPDKVGKQLLPAPSTTSSARATSTSTTQATSSSSATDFTRPGSFPYPVTITLDRHGGTASKKMVYCYGMESDQHINSTEKKFQIENRGFDGTLINPAPGIFNLSSWESLSSESSDSGGYDGGRGGCACEWVNWISAV